MSKRLLWLCGLCVAINSAYGVFRIRKCCPEGQHIYEKNGECVEVPDRSQAVYHHSNNDTEDAKLEMDKILNATSSRPSWFPSLSHILSSATNASLEGFPTGSEVQFGTRLPCKYDKLALIPSYFYSFDFFDDGSLLLYGNRTQPGDMKYDALSFCVDRLVDVIGDDLDMDFALANDTGDVELDVPFDFEFMIMLCPCLQTTCVLKCCEPSMLLDLNNNAAGDTICKVDTKAMLSKARVWDWMPDITGNSSKGYFLLPGFPHCPPGWDVVVPNLMRDEDRQQYTIRDTGTAQIEGEEFVSSSLQFCGETIVYGKSNVRHNYILRCYPEHGHRFEVTTPRRLLYGSLFIIGAVFLVLTLVIYMLLPHVKKLHDRNLIAQTASLLVGYVSMAVAQLGIKVLPVSACVFLGFLIEYSFLCAFFWLNIMCYDITKTFRGINRIQRQLSSEMLRTYAWYSVWGWGGPAVLTLVTIIVEFTPSAPKIIKPNFRSYCWFDGDTQAKLIYFYGPIAVLLVSNVIMFAYTAIKIFQVRKETSGIIKNSTLDRQRFTLYIKLFLLMGLSWATELLSWAVGGPYYFWYGTDIVNLLRAVFIFIILCCKREVIEELKKRFNINQPHAASESRRISNTKSVLTTSSSIPISMGGQEFHDITLTTPGATSRF